jgi:hypothetical protein
LKLFAVELIGTDSESFSSPSFFFPFSPWVIFLAGTIMSASVAGSLCKIEPLSYDDIFELSFFPTPF